MKTSSIFDFTVLDANQNPYPLSTLQIKQKDQTDSENKSGKSITVIVNVASE